MLVEVVTEPVQQDWLQLLVADRPGVAARDVAKEEGDVREQQEQKMKLQRLSPARVVRGHVIQQALREMVREQLVEEDLIVEEAGRSARQQVAEQALRKRDEAVCGTLVSDTLLHIRIEFGRQDTATDPHPVADLACQPYSIPPSQRRRLHARNHTKHNSSCYTVLLIKWRQKVFWERTPSLTVMGKKFSGREPHP